MLRDPSLVPLSHQHQHGLALCVLTDRSLAEDSGPANVDKLARRCVDRFEVELANHFDVEEEVLFPAFPSTLTDELTSEHRQLRQLVEQLRQSPSAAVLREFTALLRRHIRCEENELFEQVQRDVPRETLDALGARIEKQVIRVCL